MPSAKELKDELRALRKENVKPVSRMKVADIAAEIQKLRGHREETPAVAAVPSASLTKSKSAVQNIKDAKAAEFPVKPDQGITAAPKKGAKPVKPPTDKVSEVVKKTKLERLLLLMGDE